jgi:signal transduction histidine kinase
MLEGMYGTIPEKMWRPIGNVYESNERLINLVSDLLNLSRIEAGKIGMEWTTTNVEDIAESVSQELQIKAKERNLELILQKSKKSLPIVRVDQEKIRNVILNVIDNAIRYTRKGSITVKTEQVQDKIRIAISDTGAGMTKEELGKLFESFSRGGAGAQYSTEGTGLGLYIAKQFVQMHRGKIWAESPGKGRGSTFYIELPIR